MKLALPLVALISLGLAACAPQNDSLLTEDRSDSNPPRPDKYSHLDQIEKAAQESLTRFLTAYESKDETERSSDETRALLIDATELRNAFSSPHFTFENRGHHFTSSEICTKLDEIITHLQPESTDDSTQWVGIHLTTHSQKQKAGPRLGTHRCASKPGRASSVPIRMLDISPLETLTARLAQFFADYKSFQETEGTQVQAWALLQTAVQLQAEYSAPLLSLGVGGQAFGDEPPLEVLNDSVELLKSAALSPEFGLFLESLKRNFKNQEKTAKIILRLKAKYFQNIFEGRFFYTFNSKSKNPETVRIDINEFTDQLLIARRFASHPKGTSELFHSLVHGQIPVKDEILQARLTLYLSDFENSQPRTLGQAQYFRTLALDLQKEFRTSGSKAFKYGDRFYRIASVLQGLENNIQQLNTEIP